MRSNQRHTKGKKHETQSDAFHGDLAMKEWQFGFTHCKEIGQEQRSVFSVEFATRSVKSAKSGILWVPQILFIWHEHC
jgi:hypothetical protein